MDRVAQLPDNERRELFGETAAAMKTVPAIVEKDFWVVWVLNHLFQHERLQKLLQFKGGTSLSKVFDAIGRFSEDIDLILDWRTVTDEDPERTRSKTQQGKFNAATNEKAAVYIREALLPEISALLSPRCQCSMDDDNPFAIVVRYPALYDAGYLRPQILLEIGPLASWRPSDTFEIQSYAAEHFPDVFKQAICKIPTILAKRTFWEKATILHQEAHRPMEKPMPPRYSRHYYDLAQLSQSAIKQEALDDLPLLAEVVDFKQRFYPSAWSRYELAVPGSLKLLPDEARLKEIESDYSRMQAMIFAKKLHFGEIVAILTMLETEVKQMDTDG